MRFTGGPVRLNGDMPEEYVRSAFLNNSKSDDGAPHVLDRKLGIGLQ